jgi:hypothetical protein
LRTDKPKIKRETKAFYFVFSSPVSLLQRASFSNFSVGETACMHLQQNYCIAILRKSQANRREKNGMNYAEINQAMIMVAKTA